MTSPPLALPSPASHTPVTRLQSLGRVLLLALLLIALGSCHPGSQRDPERWNVLLITFDTTRADRIGCYGNDRIQTPALDKLAAEGIRFARTLSAVPITAPSHTTIHTGRYPIAHGVRDNGLFVLGDEQLTLAEILKEQGYTTAAAIGAFPLIARFGLDQGFDFFDDHLTGRFEDYSGKRTAPKERLFFDERRAAQVNEALLPWLEEHARPDAEAPFFAWVHYFDPHQPFEPAPPYDQLYADDPYNGEIAYADSSVGFLLDRLERQGVLDRTLVVFTADHGEGLGEHNELTHAVLAYNSTLHVPLIVRPPAGHAPAGEVVEAWTGTVDILPTILELLDIEAPEGLQGHSLVPLWQEGARQTRRQSIRYAENLSPRLTHGWAELRILFDGPMKYIHGPQPELYDLDVDPKEMHDLREERPEEAARMRHDLEVFLQRNAVSGVSTTEAIDDEVRQRLLALGYLHSSGSGGEEVQEVLRDDGTAPRERVGDINDLSSAKHLLFQGRFGDALVYTRRLTSRDPENPLYLELQATALTELGHLEEAWAVAQHLETTGTVIPELLMLQLTTARFEAAIRRDDSGAQRSVLDAFAAYLEASPSARGSWLLASLYLRLEDMDRHREHLDKALELDPSFAPARIDLAILISENGEIGAAEAEFQRALEDAPYYAKGHYNYGAFLLSLSTPGAIESFQRAIALAPRYLDAHLGLVAAYLDAGEREQAEEAYRTLQQVAPRSRAAASAAELLAAP